MDLDPGLLLTLLIRQRWQTVNVSLHRLVRLIISKNLLKEAEFSVLGHTRHSTNTFENTSFLGQCQIHNRRLLCILTESLSSLQPLDKHLTVPFSWKELIKVFNDFLLDVVWGSVFLCNSEKGIEKQLFRFLNTIYWEEEINESPGILDLIFYWVFGWLIWQIFQKETVKFSCTQFQVEYLLPHVSPNKWSSECILDFQSIFLETLESIVIKTNFGVNMIILIKDDSFHWSV